MAELGLAASARSSDANVKARETRPGGNIVQERRVQTSIMQRDREERSDIILSYLSAKDSSCFHKETQVILSYLILVTRWPGRPTTPPPLPRRRRTASRAFAATPTAAAAATRALPRRRLSRRSLANTPPRASPRPRAKARGGPRPPRATRACRDKTLRLGQTDGFGPRRRRRGETEDQVPALPRFARPCSRPKRSPEPGAPPPPPLRLGSGNGRGGRGPASDAANGTFRRAERTHARPRSGPRALSSPPLTLCLRRWCRWQQP
jgi:hypothetical protein